MAIERARVVSHSKPWGVVETRPWSDAADGTELIGELSFERSGAAASTPTLLLKVLFTSAALSIQVHPDDDYARSIGLPNGKSEAWYVLSAGPDAKVAVGLKKPITRDQLRQAIADGGIAELVSWRPVKARDIVDVPAGTIHAIGADVVIVEIQQRSDATFRLFDYGRDRPLHVDHALAMSTADVAPSDAQSVRASPERTALVVNPHFCFERVSLAPESVWSLNAMRETWLFVVGGKARVGPIDVARGDAVFGQGECPEVRAGGTGVEFLIAYTGDGGALEELLVPISSVAKRVAKQTTRNVQIGVGQ